MQNTKALLKKYHNFNPQKIEAHIRNLPLADRPEYLEDAMQFAKLWESANSDNRFVKLFNSAFNLSKALRNDELVPQVNYSGKAKDRESDKEGKLIFDVMNNINRLNKEYKRIHAMTELGRLTYAVITPGFHRSKKEFDDKLKEIREAQKKKQLIQRFYIDFEDKILNLHVEHNKTSGQSIDLGLFLQKKLFKIKTPSPNSISVYISQARNSKKTF